MSAVEKAEDWQAVTSDFRYLTQSAHLHDDNRELNTLITPHPPKPGPETPAPAAIANDGTTIHRSSVATLKGANAMGSGQNVVVASPSLANSWQSGRNSRARAAKSTEDSALQVGGRNACGGDVNPTNRSWNEPRRLGGNYPQ